jgi:uroporphyrinogen-III decarboxylase
MTSKDRMLSVLAGERVDAPPVVLHSWGDYKVELAGFHPKFQYCQGGEELAGIERTFYERFRPDWIHLGSAGERWFWNRPRRVEGNRAFLRSGDGTRWIEIRDDYSLTDPGDIPPRDNGPPFRLESKAAIDDYYVAIRSTVQDVLHSGRFDHLKRVASEYGDQVLIAMNDGTPGWIPGYSFEEMVIACVEKPDLVAYNVFKACERFLNDVRAAKASGAHAYIFSEGFPYSLDILSPAMHERLEGDARRWFYSEVRKTGILPIGYWLGDVRPNMQLLNSLDMAGLMIEEDKKGFTLDPVEIRRMLRPEVCLFGNLDSFLLFRGTPDAIRTELRRQIKAAAFGPFVVANGSPLIIGTPPENIDAYMQAARKGV